MRLLLPAVFVALCGSACSLLVQFDPEGQPCSTRGECLNGYGCVDGGCVRGAVPFDAGNVDRCLGVACTSAGPCQDLPGTCNPLTGTCSYVPKVLNATCTDDDACTQGDHCDGDGGCAVITTTRCTTPPGSCFADAGTCSASSGACSYTALTMGAPCEDGNLCTVNESCGAGGVCSGGVAKVCNTPPNTCTQVTGTCTPGVGCTYLPRPLATCDDLNACTQGDYCDAGTCVSGPSCPPTLPCQAGTCSAGACTYVAAADGTSCGALASQRCCTGNCIDISTNSLHCGGCGISCTNGQACESVSLSVSCTPFNPSTTSGRCTCNSAIAGTCPATQFCRSALPHSNRCAPADAGGCAPGEKIQAITTCPNYCYY